MDKVRKPSIYLSRISERDEGTEEIKKIMAEKKLELNTLTHKF